MGLSEHVLWLYCLEVIASTMMHLAYVKMCNCSLLYLFFLIVVLNLLYNMLDVCDILLTL